jgi:uncharacterized membrane protein YdfJ with MMPL/SSD domain
VRGTAEQTKTRVDATLAVTKAVQKAHPDFTVAQFGSASSEKELMGAFEKDLQKAETLSLPITVLILLVAVAMLGSITVLPAMLSKVGDGVDRGRIPFLGKRMQRRTESRIWGSVLGPVMRHPVVSTVLATSLLVALSVPALGMHTASSGLEQLPQTPIRKTFDRVQKAFPGTADPGKVVIKADDVSSPEVRSAIGALKYHVYILSRVREGFDRGLSTDEAVTQGIKQTAGVVTSAAFVMVGVFAIFGTLSIIDYKMLGVGLAFAIFLDATIVRAVLLPATMKLLGDRNWYLPSWLEWLPRLDHEAAVDAPEPRLGGPVPEPAAA